MRVGVSTLPFIRRDATDRNRTSPFAFTGNKFEFRMVPSSGCIADANTVLNTIAAEAFQAFADELEKAEDFEFALNALIRREMTAHQRIIFQRQRLYRRVGGRSDAARPAESEEHGGRGAGAGETCFHRAVRPSGRIHREGTRARADVSFERMPRRSTSRR